MAEGSKKPGESAEKQTLSSAVTSDLVTLDPNGDMVLRCHDQATTTTKSFLVASNILQLASPYFVRLLGPNFKEGTKLLNEERPIIELKGDNVILMSMILHALHLRGSTKSTVLPKGLAQLAIICDKYSLTSALEVWIDRWFSFAEKLIFSSKDMGYLLVAASVLNDAKRFRELTKNAIRKTKMGFQDQWKDDELLGVLHDGVQDALATHIKQTMDKMFIDIQNAELVLSQSTSEHSLRQKECSACKMHHTATRATCPCGGNIQSRKCTTDSRIARYFALLRSQNLFPITQPLERYPVRGIVSRIATIYKNNIDNCEQGFSCPLVTILATLKDSTELVMSSSITGLCLECMKQDDAWDGSKTCTHT